MTNRPNHHDCCSVAAEASAEDSAEASAEALEALRAEQPTGAAAALRSAGFTLLLEEGRPIEKAEWAAAAGTTEEELGAIVDDALRRGRVQLDESGRLVGIAGLTVEPTRHEILVDGEPRWTWCALDAVGILGALGGNGAIRSSDPATGAPIEIGFTDGVPDGDAVMFILGGFDGGDVVRDWCPNVNFFTNREAADAWVADRGLAGDIVAMLDIAPSAADMWRQVVGSEGAAHVC